MAKRLNIDTIIGITYNYLTILNESEPYITLGGHKHRSVIAKCVCGTVKRYDIGAIISENTKSCGCWDRKSASDRLRKRMTTHGRKHTSEYNSWKGMRVRCTNPKDGSYLYYGGRGITVCDRWLNSFENFYDDMGDKPTPQHSIDRIDVNGNYEPSNCRWATTKEQANNKTNSVAVTICGETKPIEQWAIEIGISRQGLQWRIDKGYDDNQLLKRSIKKDGKWLKKRSKYKYWYAHI
jgi:hypothetical protein